MGVTTERDYTGGSRGDDKRRWRRGARPICGGPGIEGVPPSPTRAGCPRSQDLPGQKTRDITIGTYAPGGVPATPCGPSFTLARERRQGASRPCRTDRRSPSRGNDTGGSRPCRTDRRSPSRGNDTGGSRPCRTDRRSPSRGNDARGRPGHAVRTVVHPRAGTTPGAPGHAVRTVVHPRAGTTPGAPGHAVRTVVHPRAGTTPGAPGHAVRTVVHPRAGTTPGAPGHAVRTVVHPRAGTMQGRPNDRATPPRGTPRNHRPRLPPPHGTASPRPAASRATGPIRCARRGTAGDSRRRRESVRWARSAGSSAPA